MLEECNSCKFPGSTVIQDWFGHLRSRKTEEDRPQAVAYKAGRRVTSVIWANMSVFRKYGDSVLFLKIAVRHIVINPQQNTPRCLQHTGLIILATLWRSSGNPLPRVFHSFTVVAATASSVDSNCLPFLRVLLWEESEVTVLHAGCTE